MTTVNVSSTKNSDLSALSARVQENMSVVGNIETNNFQSFMNLGKTTSNSDQSFVNSKSSDVSQITTNGFESKPKEISMSETTDIVNENVMDQVSEEIRDSIKETLGISDEELDENLIASGMTILDLIHPENLVQFMANVNQTDTINLVTDLELSTQLQELLTTVTDTINQLASEFGMTSEDFITQLDQISLDQRTELESELSLTLENLSQTADGDAETMQTEAETVVTVTTNAESGKTIEIKMVGNEVVEENAVFTKTEELDQSSFEQQGFTQNGDSGNNSNESMAENFLQNLVKAVDVSTANATTFESTMNTNSLDIINQIIDAVKVNVSGQLSTMEIQLTPENLGKINLTVSSKDGVITASIITQNETVKNAVESQMLQLKDNLNNQGIKVQSVEVSIANQGLGSEADQNNQNNKNQNQSGKAKKFRGMDEISENDGFVEEIKEHTLSDGNSVNLTA